eukprot:scaffold254430_cov31-Tisochrysis_lutea.AAC.5
MAIRFTSKRKGKPERRDCTPAGLPRRSAVSAEFIESCSKAVRGSGVGASRPTAWRQCNRKCTSPHEPRPPHLASESTNHPDTAPSRPTCRAECSQFEGSSTSHLSVVIH